LPVRRCREAAISSIVAGNTVSKLQQHTRPRSISAKGSNRESSSNHNR
jgi:hypothetical protein